MFNSIARIIRMQQLPSYRNNKSIWQDLAYSASTSESKQGYDYNFDANAKNRYALLIELQYNLQKEDEELIRYLLIQEILASETHGMGGASDSLMLNIYLLATFKNPDDIILFYKAKYSNFDTSCAVGSEFMFYALADKTEAFTEKNFPEIYDDIKGLYSRFYSESALSEWWHNLLEYYPDCIKNEDLYTLYQRSFYFDDYTLARNYLEQWNEKTPDSANKKSVLKHAYVEFEEYSKVIELLKEELVACETSWERTSCLGDLLDFYTRTEQSENAYTVVESIDKELQKSSDWKNTGLVQMTIEQIFEFSVSTNNAEFAIKAFNLAYKWLGKIKGSISYVGLNIALNAANRYGLVKESDQLGKLVLAKKRKLDKDFETKNWFKSAMARLFRTL